MSVIRAENQGGYEVGAFRGEKEGPCLVWGAGTGQDLADGAGAEEDVGQSGWWRRN